MYLFYVEQVDRHLRNAFAHEQAGHPAEWAARSREKAAKWKRRSEEIAQLKKMDDPTRFSQDLVDLVVFRLMYGIRSDFTGRLCH